MQEYGKTQEPIIHARGVDSNFPLAIHRDEQQITRTDSQLDPDHIREQIIQNPQQGARALSDYLAKNPQWHAQRNAVDLGRTNLQRIEEETRLFGSDASSDQARNRIIFNLLNIIQEII
jgi:hypothetical protein